MWPEQCAETNSTPNVDQYLLQNQLFGENIRKLLDHLTSAPVLGYPDSSQPFVLHTNASQEGLGAVLYQRQDGKMRVIGFWPRSLTKAERNYHLHSGKLEFLALRWAVCEDFRDYLYYAPHFVMSTDNNPLTC